MLNQDTKESPEMRVTYGAYLAKSDAASLKSEIVACDNPIALQEAASLLQDAQDELNARMREIALRVNALYNLPLAVA